MSAYFILLECVHIVCPLFNLCDKDMLVCECRLFIKSSTNGETDGFVLFAVKCVLFASLFKPFYQSVKCKVFHITTN